MIVTLRASFTGPEANLADAVAKLDATRPAGDGRPSWAVALDRVRLPLYDVHWTPAIVVEKRSNRNGADSIRVGLRDGRIMPLSTSG